MICCNLREKSLQEFKNVSISSPEEFKKHYLAHIVPLFLLKENCCSECKELREDFQKVLESLEKGNRIDSTIIEELFQKERYSKENVFYLSCETAEQAQDWIKNKSQLLGKEILWVADSSLKEFGVIRKESDEEKLIDNLHLPDNFLLVFLPFACLGEKDIDFSQAYAVIIDEAHRNVWKVVEIVSRDAFFVTKMKPK